jgi:hypothetical protein
VKETGSDKHSNLLKYGINYGRNFFIDTAASKVLVRMIAANKRSSLFSFRNTDDEKSVKQVFLVSML